MNGPWALRLEAANARRAVKIRTLPGVQAAVDGRFWWLKGDNRNKETAFILSTIADGPVYEIAQTDLLIPVGCLVPTERLPKLDWQPLAEVISLEIPSPAIARTRVAKVRLKLVRSTSERPASILLCEFSAFAEWADTASEIRIHACRFAAARSDNELPAMAIIKGTPLPPVPGRLFWLAGNVAIPSGFEWAPAVDEVTLRAALVNAFEACPDSAVIMWNANSDFDAATAGFSESNPRSEEFPKQEAVSFNGLGECVEMIAQTDFITATRTNVRATLASLISGERCG